MQLHNSGSTGDSLMICISTSLRKTKLQKLVMAGTVIITPAQSVMGLARKK